MYIKFSLDKNVTSEDTIKYLKSIRLISIIEENMMLKKDATLNLYIEVGNSAEYQRLHDIGKDNLYCSVLNNTGISLFTTDDSTYNTFIPMNNILSIISRI